MTDTTIAYPFTGTLMGRAVKAIETHSGEPMSANPLGRGWEGCCPICDQSSLILDFDPDEPNAVFAFCQPQWGDGCDLSLIYRALQIEAPSQKYRDMQTSDPADEYDPSDELFERDVEERAYQLRVSEAARERVNTSKALQEPLPTLIRLDEFLNQPDTDPPFRIDSVGPAGANIVIAAAFKSGKTTFIGNLARCLVDGEPFLGVYPVHGVEGTNVTIIDDELDPRTLRRWLRDQGIRNAHKVRVVSLRGRVGTFDIRNPTIRAQWAELLRGSDTVIWDCLKPVLDALGLNEHTETGQLLVPFDALKLEAGISEAFVVHHMGHTGERSRGDSRLQDWPDATWKLVRERSPNGDEDVQSPRYFSAFGRDVNVSESRLAYDPETRHLTLAGGNRAQAQAESELEDVMPDLIAVLTKYGSITQNACQRYLQDEHGHGQKEARRVIKASVDRGVTQSQRLGQAIYYRLAGTPQL